ncbi:MAG TPA: GlsB/YeaQ/YmgE family stress response membrane protein [Actinomycetota bacterium]|nr:GlsB/YeaQ/YmgE family stress response membrane protein [Actinomycetota bacterium]
MGIIVWLIIGLIAGFIARLLVPGRDPMGFLGTLLLGLVGSLIGGFLGGLLQSGDDTFEPAGIIGSIVGAVIALLIYRAVAGRRRGPVAP